MQGLAHPVVLLSGRSGAPRAGSRWRRKQQSFTASAGHEA